MRDSTFSNSNLYFLQINKILDGAGLVASAKPEVVHTCRKCKVLQQSGHCSYWFMKLDRLVMLVVSCDL